MKFLELVESSLAKFRINQSNPTAVKIECILDQSIIQISFSKDDYSHINELEKINYISIEEFELRTIEDAELTNINNLRVLIYNSVLECNFKNSLPTTLLKYNGQLRDDILHFSENEIFGKTIVKHLREEPMQNLEWNLEKYTNKSEDQIIREFPDHWDEKFRKERLEIAKHYLSFSEQQIKFIRKLVLESLDIAAFDLLRAIDENTGQDTDPIKVEIRGISGVDIPMFGNGNLSSDYIEWIERYSQYERTF